MEQAGSRDPSFDFPVQGTTGSSSLRLQPCALKPPVRILVIDDERSFVQWAGPGSCAGMAIPWIRRTMGRPDWPSSARSRYDVVLCDLRMPALDGPTLYALVQQQYPDLCQRMIFVTGDTLGIESSRVPGAVWPTLPVQALHGRRRPACHSAAAGPRRVHRDRCTRRGRRAATTGSPCREEGTLSIVWRGEAYHVRYASTNPYAPEYPARVCPDEATLRALLHALGTDAEALQYACAVARTGKHGGPASARDAWAAAGLLWPHSLPGKTRPRPHRKPS